MPHDLIQADSLNVCHGSPPDATRSWKQHRGWYAQEPARAQALQITRITYKCALALPERASAEGYRVLWYHSAARPSAMRKRATVGWNGPGNN